MDFEEIKVFQVAQKEIVAMIGAFIVPLKSFSDSLSTSEDEGIDFTGLRKLQLVVSEFLPKASCVEQFCTKHNYRVYYDEIRRPSNRIAALLGNQTLPSKALEKASFKAQLNLHIEGISEVMMAIAQIVTPNIDTNIKAGNSFSAYCLISSLMDSAVSMFIIVDPYIDQSIFYRYLYRLASSVNIRIVTDQKKLTGERLKSFESVESLFQSEYANYKRSLWSYLHDRYLINETDAYSLGGSIKDAAIKSDYSIIQLSEAKRNELLKIYA